MTHDAIPNTVMTEEAMRRRTFAIISHPDAGKTTITEKLLLYANAIHLAGSVKSKRGGRQTVSDWMTMEKERGISISSSVLQFEHLGKALNLLDTPGHADFSEDTYRTLAAVDSSLMLIDHAKGVEKRTLKLFEVCRLRKLPVITFMNKLDRAGLDPLSLLDEVSKALSIRVVPFNWPIGMGKEFRGVIDIATRTALLFTAQAHGAEVLSFEQVPWDDAAPLINDRLYERVCEELELVEMAGDPYDRESFLAGEVTPVFWGSAMTNFGIAPLLKFLAEDAAPPLSRTTIDDVTINPGDDQFSGFIFKIQANMNPKHRDRIAFMRVVSGEFKRGMEVVIGRNNERLKLSKPHSFLAEERAIVENAWPGDIVGLYDPGKLRVGDTLAEGTAIKYSGIPRFAPEFFMQAVLKDPLKRKALDQGLEQLAHEGVIQLFSVDRFGRRELYLGAVGMLQFEVLKDRLKNEYRVNAVFHAAPYRIARWIGGAPEGLKWLCERKDYLIAKDRNDQPVLLAESPWPLQYALDNAKGLELHDIEPL